MKLSTIKTDKTGDHLKTWDFASFIERIRTDANRQIITCFRDETTPEMPTRYNRYAEIPRVYAAVELQRQQNGAPCFAACNGLVVIEVRQLMSDKVCADVKAAAMSLPSTLATFIGATGTEVIILVRVERADGTWPATEAEAEALYNQAYDLATRVYDGALPAPLTRMEPSLRHAFLMPLDPAPLMNDHPMPLRITATYAPLPSHADDGLPSKVSSGETDYTAYENYERAYTQALVLVCSRIGRREDENGTWYETFVTAMSTVLCKQGWPEEETVLHLWRHLAFEDVAGMTQDFVRTTVAATYAQTRVARGTSPAAKEPLMEQVIRYMESRYVLRHNTVMGYTEYRPNNTWVTPWQPVTDKVINTFTTDLQIAGLDAWDRDVRRYVHSTRIRDYNPITAYLLDECCRWDGRDRIRQLAATVPTDNPAQWAEWFHTWFLAMVAQWQGRDRRYGNAIVPLLISEQGMHKSAFCRSLLPPELRKWGYTDNLSLTEERPVHLAMSQMLLINLDEFNRISPQKQQGFLKNILQLPAVKVKRPYATHTEEVPRLASFIATTNMPDVLTDPTGSRRFIGVQLTGNIDISQTPNYPQLYAQARAELDSGCRYWFDDDETRAIMQHNRRFQQQSSAEMFFRQYFGIPTSTTDAGEWMTATAILLTIKQRAGSVFQAPAANVFGRTLHGIPGLLHRRKPYGSEFYVNQLTSTHAEAV